VALLAPLDLRVLRVFRLIRFLKLARYSPALSSLWGTLVAERRALLGAFIIMMGLLMLCSSLIYFVESAVQPEVFGSVPQAMWWGLATLTTVGYGDVVPVTALGRLIGGIVMILGLGLFALPIGIIATGWSQEIHRREFVVTWGMVARVPFFSRLDAVSVAEIMTLLRSKVARAGEIIVAKNEVPHSMYFIADGRLEVQLPSGPKYLDEGDFFGAVALIKGHASPANVRAVVKTHLLSIDADDFKSLCQRDATLRQHIHDVAENRLAEGWFQSPEEVASEAPIEAPPLGLDQAGH
jgi:voltage-gated potassium channel